MANCWPGCRAKVVNDHPLNPGVMVLVIKAEMPEKDDPLWIVRTLSPSMTKDGRSIPTFNYTIVRDSSLQPFGPLTDEAVNAEAFIIRQLANPERKN